METVKIVNKMQVDKYLKAGVKPIDLFFDHKTDTTVFIYEKDDKLRDLYTKWLNRELN